MPTVGREGQYRFVVNTRENEFEPPHVHVWAGNEDVCRIVLDSWMDPRLENTEASSKLTLGIPKP